MKKVWDKLVADDDDDVYLISAARHESEVQHISCVPYCCFDGNFVVVVTVNSIVFQICKLLALIAR